ncbi:Plasmid stability protein [Modestobacter sp. DSM 44400]|uniref:FitA-like ribbon-helix-helix domain-containing protein n=1 Tax=Modestobacter sp. DSM 44400 TaxID=1550230 RepID=UPI00089AB2FB|nr:plasmid stabilization protein [Modestobacter sp. DSM 44400]SDX50201.1 Plasmid stability protein [Modestobacter sp. DSM 44400]
MATLTIRNLDEAVRQRLRVKAAQHGRSMEAEVREILAAAVAESESKPELERGLGSRIHALFADVGGWDVDLPPRSGTHRPIDFGE